MKKNKFNILLACLLLLVGCSNEEFNNQSSSINTLTATAEGFGNESRVGFDLGNGASFFWNSGDAIAVGTNSWSKFTTDCTDRSSSATFTGYSQGDYAVYPYRGVNGINGNTLTYNFSSTYNYGSTVDTDFFSGMSVEVPMWAPVVGNSLSFRHLGGLIAFKFPNLKSGANQTFTLKTTNGKRISGNFDVLLDGTTSKIVTEDASNEADQQVVINFTLNADATAVFYVPVPVGTYNLFVELKNGEDTFTNEYGGIVVNRREIRYTSVIATNLQGSEATVVGNAVDVTEAMESNTDVIVNNITSANPESTVTIEIPKKDTSEASAEHTLTISTIDSNTTTLNISESTEGDASISQLTINVPSMADAKKLVVNMPNTTVTVAINGMGTMTLAEVMASTADNTLIVGKDVTIGHLKVKKGNVRIYGKVNNISRTDDNTDEFTCVICEEGVTVPNNINDDEKIKLITPIWDGKTLVETADKDAAKGKVLYEVSYAEELAWVLRNWNGDVTSSTRPTTIKLMKDINFGGHEIYFDMAEVGGFHSIILDGNNHTIKNYKVAGVAKRAALFPQTSGIAIRDLTIDGAIIGSEQTVTDLYSGALIAITTDHKGEDGPYTTVIDNVIVQNSTINGVNKVGGLVGQANGVHVVSNTKVMNTTITGHGTDAGSLGGLYGYLQVEGESSFTDSKMIGGAIVCVLGEDADKRGSSGFIGTLAMSNANSSLALTGCSVDGVNLDKSNTKNPLNDLVGAIRTGTKATLAIDGEPCYYYVKVWDGSTLVQPADKDAAASRVLYKVGNAEELAWVLRHWNGGSTSASRPTTIKLMNDIDFGGHDIYYGMTDIDGFHCVTLEGNNYTIKNYKVAGVNHRAALFPQTSGVTIKDLIIDNAVIGSEQTSEDLYSGALIGISTDQKPNPYTTVITNVTIQNSTIMGVNKVGGLIGQANGIHMVSNAEVKNTTITGYGTDAGSLGGLYGYLKVEGESSFTNSRMTGGAIVCESGEDKASRGSSGFIGTLGMSMVNSSLALTGCDVSETTDLAKSNTKSPLNKFVGTIRSGTAATLTIDGQNISYY